MSSAPRPLAAVSLKTYLGQEETLRWCRQARERTEHLLGAVDLMVLPIATALAQVVREFAGSGAVVGAQDCSWATAGPYTGEVPASVLREVGARVVELGHAERRALFGEDDATVARKAARAVDAGVLPLICVGEGARMPGEQAVRECLDQLDRSCAGVTGPLVVAYEPVWAIGAEEPAPARHVRPVCSALRERVAARGPGSRVLYGGTAGPGVFAELHPEVDGLFLGRRVHEVAALVDVLQEMTRVAQDAPLSRQGGPDERQ